MGGSVKAWPLGRDPKNVPLFHILMLAGTCMLWSRFWLPLCMICHLTKMLDGQKKNPLPTQGYFSQAFKVSLSEGLLHCLAYFLSPVMQHVSPGSCSWGEIRHSSAVSNRLYRGSAPFCAEFASFLAFWSFAPFRHRSSWLHYLLQSRCSSSSSFSVSWRIK